MHSVQVTFQASTVHYITCWVLARSVDRGRKSTRRQRHTGSTRAANVITTLCISATVPDVSTSSPRSASVQSSSSSTSSNESLNYHSLITFCRTVRLTIDNVRQKSETDVNQRVTWLRGPRGSDGRRRHVRLVIEEFLPAAPPEPPRDSRFAQSLVVLSADTSSAACRVVCWRA